MHAGIRVLIDEYREVSLRAFSLKRTALKNTPEDFTKFANSRRVCAPLIRKPLRLKGLPIGACIAFTKLSKRGAKPIWTECW